MSATKVDTSYRLWSLAALEAVKLSILIQLKNVEGVGQSHAANGRQTTLPDIEKLAQQLTNIEAALAWKNNAANNGNTGFASRYSSFSNSDC